MIKRRKDIGNEKRIECMIKHLRKNEKFGRYLYPIYAILITLLPILAVLLKAGGVKIFLLVIIVISVFTIGVIKLFKNKRDGKVQIETNFNVEELFIWSPGGKTVYPMGKYRFVTYYVDGMATYRFHCVVRDDQTDLYAVINRLVKEGSIPKVKVLVNPDNFNDYIVLGYDFIEDLLKLNLELAGEELDEHYDTSVKWKCIK